MNTASIFVSYAAADTVFAERLTRELTDAGFTLAVNRHTVPPGQHAETILRNATATAARFIVCFSSRNGAPTTYDTGELLFAMERMAISPADECWLIPVKLTRCDLPRLPIGTRTLHELASIDLSVDWAGGLIRLVDALPPRVESSGSQPPESTVTSRLDFKADTLNADIVTLDNVQGAAFGTAGHTTIEARQVTTGQFTVANVRGKR